MRSILALFLSLLLITPANAMRFGHGVAGPLGAQYVEMGPQGFPYPNWPLYIGTLEDSNAAINATTLSASGSRVAFIGRVYQNDLTCRNGTATKNIQSIGFSAGAKSGTWTLQADVESVSTSAGPPVQPTGTILGGGSASTTIASGSVTNNAYNTSPNLGAVATVHCFDEVAVVLSFSAYTSGSLAIAGGLATDPSPWGPVQSNSTDGGTTWTAASVGAGSTITVMLQLNFDDGTAGTFEGTAPIAYNSSNQISLNTTSTPREVGLQFSAPMDGQINGLWIALSTANGSSNATFNLTDTAATPNVLCTLSVLGSQNRGAGGTSGMAWFPCTSGRATLTRNTNYVVGLAGTSASPNNAVIPVQSFSATKSLQALFACGSTCGKVTRTSSSAAWTGFTNTTIPWLAVNYVAINKNSGP